MNTQDQRNIPDPGVGPEARRAALAALPMRAVTATFVRPSNERLRFIRQHLQ